MYVSLPDSGVQGKAERGWHRAVNGPHPAILTTSWPDPYHVLNRFPDIKGGPVATIPELKDAQLQQQYESLDRPVLVREEAVIDAECLLAFRYEYPGQETQVDIDTDEFTAVCPWTRLPDYGTLTISYIPGESCIELKSLKYYLLSYRDVGIVQEHAANRILLDLVALCHPRSMKVTLDYKVRGGIHTAVTVEHPGN